MIYFDNAATTGTKPPQVIAAVTGALKDLSVNPGRGGYERSVRCTEKIYEARRKLSSFFGADAPERVVFTANCTTAVNTVIKGIVR
ncbi:MAG: aminotransferase class V-fold PLP-dependent enzyme, partial [Acutalibacteraceae bacterium]